MSDDGRFIQLLQKFVNLQVVDLNYNKFDESEFFEI